MKNIKIEMLDVDKETLIVAMIEDLTAVDNLESILSVKGLDAILIGPYDLSASMRIIGKFSDIRFKKITQKK